MRRIDWPRRVVAWLVPWVAAVVNARKVRGLSQVRSRQARLRAAYGIEDHTPIEGYGPALTARFEDYAATHPGVSFATTSGSTAAPKRIPFDKRRLKRFAAVGRDAALVCYAHLGVRRVDMISITSVAKDSSFTAKVMHRGRDWPSLLEMCIEPGRLLMHPDLISLAERYGTTATRYWVLLLTHPAVLYATNPSTLALLLDELHDDWRTATALVRDWVDREPSLPLATLDEAVRRASSDGHASRMRRVAESEEPIPLHEILPDIRTFVCWDGGYVGVFLERVRRWLPEDRYCHVPMFSMSTETLQTVPVSVDGRLHFVPMAPDVLVELLPADAEDLPQNLLEPWEARAGERYVMVVSDPYGLRRYQTEDVFRCEAMVGEVPDLRFERRRGLTWSFTGEKLTGQQVELALEALDAPLLVGSQQTLIPLSCGEDGNPAYCLAVVVSHDQHPLAGEAAAEERSRLGEAFDSALGEVNDEFAGKRASGRLGPTVVRVVPLADLAQGLDHRSQSDEGRVHRAWESQFKLTPLTRTRWEEIRWPTAT